MEIGQTYKLRKDYCENRHPRDLYPVRASFIKLVGLEDCSGALAWKYEWGCGNNIWHDSQYPYTHLSPESIEKDYVLQDKEN